jgi:hypothetical protein
MEVLAQSPLWGLFWTHSFCPRDTGFAADLLFFGRGFSGNVDITADSITPRLVIRIDNGGCRGMQPLIPNFSSDKLI